MARNRFVHPDVVRVPLSEGDWIDVKQELNAGEARRLWTGLVLEFNQGEKAKLDPEKVGLTKILAYVVGWSFTDAAGQRVPFSEAALLNLAQDDFKEVLEAVDAHEAAAELVSAARKNVPAITSVSAPTS